MNKFRYTAVAVFAFALGVLIRDQAQDYTPTTRACERAKENADRFGRALAHALNGGDDVLSSCTATRIRKDVYP